TIRLARVRRGVDDAGLLALAALVDAPAARAELARVVFRALADVAPNEPPPWARPETLAQARATLHEIIARGRARGSLSEQVPGGVSQAALVMLSAPPAVPRRAKPRSSLEAGL